MQKKRYHTCERSSTCFHESNSKICHLNKIFKNIIKIKCYKLEMKSWNLTVRMIKILKKPKVWRIMGTDNHHLLINWERKKTQNFHNLRKILKTKCHLKVYIKQEKRSNHNKIICKANLNMPPNKNHLLLLHFLI